MESSLEFWCVQLCAGFLAQPAPAPGVLHLWNILSTRLAEERAMNQGIPGPAGVPYSPPTPTHKGMSPEGEGDSLLFPPCDRSLLLLAAVSFSPVGGSSLPGQRAGSFWSLELGATAGAGGTVNLTLRVQLGPGVGSLWRRYNL